MLKTLTISFVFLFGLNSFSQMEIEHYFHDTTARKISHLYESIKVEDGIIISGKIDSADYEIPLVMKLDPNGNIIWSTYNNYKEGLSNCRYFGIKNSEDGFIYGFTSRQVAGPGNYHKMLWKVNAETGIIVWITPFYSIPKAFLQIKDVDSSRFMMTYELEYELIFAFINKTDGDTIETRNLGDYPSYHDIQVDHNKNIYFAKDSVLTKYHGDNFDQVLWEKKYLESPVKLETIKRIHFDKYDNVYLFGGRGSGFSIDANARVSPYDGNLIWSSSAGFNNITIRDFEDRFGYLYSTYRHIYFGGGTYLFSTSKTNKETGEVIWEQELNMDPVGDLDIDYGEEQAGLSIATNCNGDVFTTGYYDGGAYGPGLWGIMRQSGDSGDKIYDLTIIVDSTHHDDLSEGESVQFFGDQSVFLGNLQDSIDDTSTPTYVSINPESGEVIAQKPIGSEYAYLSKTIDIKQSNDSTFVYKQIGKTVAIECYAPFDNLIWSTVIGDTTVKFGNQFTLSGTHLYLTTSTPKQDSLAPYYKDSIQYISIYQLDRADGALMDGDSLVFSESLGEFIELEADEDVAYLFYSADSILNYRSWSISEFSEPETLEPLGDNTAFEGGINIIQNYSTDALFYIGESAIYSIDKSTLLSTETYVYDEPQLIYDSQTYDDALYLCGRNAANEQVVNAFSTDDFELIWQEVYEYNGALYQLRNNSEHLFLGGIKNGKSQVHKVDLIDGELNWTYFIDTVLYPSSVPLTLEYNSDKDQVVLAGKTISDTDNANLFISLIEPFGASIFSYVKTDGFGFHNYVNSIIILDEDNILAGGAYNGSSYRQSGLIYKLQLAAEFDVSEVNNNEQNDVRVYPNPSNGTFNIDLGDGNYDSKRVVIYNALGQVIYQNNNVTSQIITIDMGGKSKGLYLMDIIEDSTVDKIYSTKIILQ